MFSGPPAVDELPSMERASPQELQEQADAFVKDRFLSKLQDLVPQAVVHIPQVSPYPLEALLHTCRPTPQSANT